MLRQLLASVSVAVAATFIIMAPLTEVSVAQAADKQCKADADCGEGLFCILALNPPVCKAPMPAGSPCKRDVVCQSKKCEIPEGKPAGTCK